MTGSPAAHNSAGGAIIYGSFSCPLCYLAIDGDTTILGTDVLSRLGDAVQGQTTAALASPSLTGLPRFLPPSASSPPVPPPPTMSVTWLPASPPRATSDRRSPNPDIQTAKSRPEPPTAEAIKCGWAPL